MNSSSPERVGIYFSGLQFHPWIDILPQEKSPTVGLELTTFRSICHMQICDSFKYIAKFLHLGKYWPTFLREKQTFDTIV
jgi:hypothetical protein